MCNRCLFTCHQNRKTIGPNVFGGHRALTTNILSSIETSLPICSTNQVTEDL